MSSLDEIVNDRSLTIDKKVYEIASSFGLPVAMQRIYENEVNDYNYIIIRKGMLRKTSESAYVRQIEIVYVFEGEQTIDDYDIINNFEKINTLKFVRMEPDEAQVQQTNKWLDMNTYIFEIPERNIKR